MSTYNIPGGWSHAAELSQRLASQRPRRSARPMLYGAVILAALLLLCARAEASAQPANVVNLNTATVAELQFLPGVGESLAARIVAGRPYASPDDLAKVKGFGGDGKRLAALRPYLVTSGPTTLHAKIRTAGAR